MDRRTLLTGIGATVGASITMFSLPLSEQARASSTTDYNKIIETAGRCHITGLKCLEHCEEALRTGNREMAECMTTVGDMLAACEALQRLAARHSKFLAPMSKVCADILDTCAKSCDKFATKMTICKECRDACLECAKACRTVT